ncbi:MAG: LysR family transcriptional regulator [Myxococcales bacterium]|nr:LysR family transcriptional regulator [Myxococcales bacterium]
MKQKPRPKSRRAVTTVDETGVLGGIDLLRALDETRSATRTAARLGTTTATVLRHLEALEARLGARLFDRLPTGLRPTPAVDLARPWAEQAHAAGAALLREICNTEQTASGVVRLAVPPAVAALFVVPALPCCARSTPTSCSSSPPRPRSSTSPCEKPISPSGPCAPRAATSSCNGSPARASRWCARRACACRGATTRVCPCPGSAGIAASRTSRRCRGCSRT